MGRLVVDCHRWRFRDCEDEKRFYWVDCELASCREWAAPDDDCFQGYISQQCFPTTPVILLLVIRSTLIIIKTPFTLGNNNSTLFYVCSQYCSCQERLKHPGLSINLELIQQWSCKLKLAEVLNWPGADNKGRLLECWSIIISSAEYFLTKIIFAIWSSSDSWWHLAATTWHLKFPT